MKVKINLWIRTVSSGSSLICSCPFIYSIVFISFVTRKRSWSDWMMIKCWDNDVTCLPLTFWHRTIVAQTFNKVIQIPVYLSKISRWQAFSNDSNHSAFCSGFTLLALTSDKYSKCQLAGVQSWVLLTLTGRYNLETTTEWSKHLT